METMEGTNFPWKGKEKIIDSKGKAVDTNLFDGRCEMDEFSFNIMIRKGVEIKKQSYVIMQNFHHETCIPHLNFYSEGNMGRLAVPRAKASFLKWMQKEGQPLLFDGHGNISVLFKTMISDLCDLVDNLHEEKILIKNLHLKNLYLAAETTPRILLLVTEVERFARVNRIELWKPVKEVIECILNECKVSLNYQASRCLGYIVTENFAVKSLKRYPNDWDDLTKGDYLISLIAANQKTMRSAISKSGISWPRVNGELRAFFSLIINHQKGRFNYSDKIGFDYIILIRNTYKHFDRLPSYVKQQFGSKDGFLKMIEQLFTKYLV